MRPMRRSDMRGTKMAGSGNASASRIVMVGSESQVGIEESIKGLESHPHEQRWRTIQDSIVEERVAWFQTGTVSAFFRSWP